MWQRLPPEVRDYDKGKITVTNPTSETIHCRIFLISHSYIMGWK